MEFCKANYLNTTTQLTIDSNTGASSNLFDYKPKVQYISTGFADDATTTSITVAFDATKSVSRIGLMGLNVKALDIFYNGATASTFALTSTADTTTSQWSTNSQTSMYLNVNAIDCTSVTFDLKSTFVSGSEKAIGHIYLGTTELIFDRIPSAKNYKIKYMPKEVVHKMSDGSRRRHYVSEAWNASIKYKYITESFRNNLRTVYDLNTDLVFVPFGTSTGWDTILFNSIWSGPFEFYQHSDDAANAGFSGSIRLWEAT